MRTRQPCNQQHHTSAACSSGKSLFDSIFRDNAVHTLLLPTTTL